MSKQQEIRPTRAWATVSKNGIVASVALTMRQEDRERVGRFWPGYRVVRVQISPIKETK